MRTPDRGLDNRRQPGGQMTSLRGSCPQGERSESIPLTAIISDKSLYESTGFFLL
ncbi:hypothetical protein ABIB59_000377 [Citrobacter sp. UYEF32]